METDICQYKVNALSGVHFNLVFTEEDLEKINPKCKFQPEMAHQVFGETETIFGYKDLCVDLYYLHNSSKCFVNIKYSDKVEAQLEDDIVELMNPWLPTNFTLKKHEFIKTIEHEKHDQIFGTIIHQFERITEVVCLSNEKVTCQYKITLCDPQDQLFQEYHQRLETFIIWFIDAANFIDLCDERWLIFYIYEEFVHPKTKETIITPIGYSAIYKFFLYPSNNRARISQFFILPTHQKKGFGTELYKAIYNKILKDMPDIIDITVEEPSEKFQKIRDICDSILVFKDLQENNDSLTRKSPKILHRYMSKHKICKRQSSRLADILGYYNALKSGTEEVKSFTDSLFEKMKNQIERDSESSKLARNSNEQDNKVMLEEAIKARFYSYLPQIKIIAEKLQNILG